MLENMMWKDIFDNLTAGVYIVNRKGNYIYANSSFLKMAGGEVGDLPKLNVFNFVRKNAVVTAFREKRRVTMINNVVTFKGYRYRQIILAKPIFDDMGEVEYVVAEMTNINVLLRILQTAARVEDEDHIECLQELRPNEDFVAVSGVMQRLLERAKQIAEVDCTVLIDGDTGTGKEVMAQFIHKASKRRNQKMVEINCAALPENLLESELFGYEKGAFTSAGSAGKQGLIKMADGGTLFLDEINSLPLGLQGKLLRVLETKKIQRVGSTKEEDVDFRLLIASNVDLRKSVEEGSFRADLYYRIAVVPITLPPLRERKEDIIPLALYFLSKFCSKYGREKTMANSALAQLTAYNWPGNVRELKNTIESLVVTVSADTLEIQQLPEHILTHQPEAPASPQNHNLMFSWEDYRRRYPDSFSLQGYLDCIEKNVLAEILAREGSTRKAANVLKIDQSTIVRKKQKYHIQ